MAFIALSPTLCFAENIKHVIDGDTVLLEDNRRIRLIGIDAPEIDHPEYGRAGEPYGAESAQYLKKLVEGKEVRLEYGADRLDKYGRTLAYIYMPNGLFVNQAIIEAGYAETYRRFEFAYKEIFLRVEKQARENKVGMWVEKPDTWMRQFKHWWTMRGKRKDVTNITDN